MVAVSLPAGGEMSGLTAHFFFGANFLPQGFGLSHKIGSWGIAARVARKTQHG